MNRILALVIKDFRLFFSDKKALLITFLVPIGIASFFGAIFGDAGGGGDAAARKIPVLVVDEDRTPLVAKIVRGMEKDSLAAPRLVSEAEATQAVKGGKAAAAVVFPKGFAKAAPQAMFSGEPPTVELRYDPSKKMEAQALQGSIMQVAMAAVSAQAFAPGADFSAQTSQVDASAGLSAVQKQNFHALFDSLRKVQAIPATGSGGGGAREPFRLKAVAQTAERSGEEKGSLAHTFAGMAVQGVLFFGINEAMGLLRDRRLGVWRRLRASPATLLELLAGKALSSALVGALVLVGVLAFGAAVFGIRVSGSWLGLAAVVLATGLMTAAFGLLVAALGRTEAQSRGLATLAVLAMSMLGGAWFPSFMMPGWVQKISLAVPVRWSVDGFDAMLWRGGGLSAAYVPVAGLLFFTAVFGAVAAFRFRTLSESA